MVHLALAVALAAPAPPEHGRGCASRRCHIRVAHKQANAKKRRVIRPYLGWLAALRQCESTNNRLAHSGPYHGYYQFDMKTYASVGGKRDPHLDGLLEQSYRAVKLRLIRGTAPWPVCG